MALDRVQAGEHHRLQFLEAGERFERRARRLGHRVADLGVGDNFDIGDDEADFAHTEIVDGRRLWREHAQPVNLEILLRRHQTNLHLRPQHAVDDADDDDDAAVGVVPGVEDQRLQRRVRVADRRMKALDDRFEDVLDARPFLGAGQDGRAAVETDDVFDLTLALVRLRARQVDLVDDRNDLEVVLDGEIGVGERLRFDALRRVNEQQRALAGRQRACHLVAEIDVTRRVDQVEHVGLAVSCRVVQSNRVRLDGDAALALEVHGIENLSFHLARLQGAGEFEESVRQRRLAMVDVRDD
jgi:hypothetical protein